MNSALSLLVGQRDALEAEAEAIASELSARGPNGEPPIGLDAPLVDGEGFPRADIDLVNARSKRGRLRALKYEHKELMKRIEALLHATFAAMPVAQTSAPQPRKAKLEGAEQQAIALINEVLEGSPASAAGLLNGDALLRFGSVDADTADPLSQIPGQVKGSVNAPIEVVIRRRGEAAPLVLSITPSTWGGRGLLGCHLAPVQLL